VITSLHNLHLQKWMFPRSAGKKRRLIPTNVITNHHGRSDAMHPPPLKENITMSFVYCFPELRCEDRCQFLAKTRK